MNRPNVPQDAEEAIALLNDCCEEYRIYLFPINEPANKEFAIGFMSLKWLTTIPLDSNTLLQAKATFFKKSKQRMIKKVFMRI